MRAYEAILCVISTLMMFTSVTKMLKYSAIRKFVRRSERRVRRSIKRVMRGQKGKERRNKYENNTKFITDKMLAESSEESSSSSAYESQSEEKNHYQRLI